MSEECIKMLILINLKNNITNYILQNSDPLIILEIISDPLSLILKNLALLTQPVRPGTRN